MNSTNPGEIPAANEERQPGLADKVAARVNFFRLIVVNEIAGTINDVITQPDRLAVESLWRYMDRVAAARVSISNTRQNEFLRSRGLPAL